MRQELRDFLNAASYPDEYDLSRTLWIARKFHSGRFELAIRDQNEAAKECKTEEEFMTYADDIHWYAHDESFFVWHFCLLRLQAILEGIIVGKLLALKGAGNLHGLKSKLDALTKAGYQTSETDYATLLQWAELRNQLSHFPPGSHSPGPLEEADIVEYHDLCLRLCKEWNAQLARVNQ
jgi:hypothetical protein